MNDNGRRLFLACWPDETLRARLHQLSRKLHRQTGGRRVARDNLHMTLLFLGRTPPEREQDLRRLCRALEMERFSLALDRVGIWRRPRIVWAAPSSTPVALVELVRRLNRLAGHVGHETEKRVWKPHVTLLRKAGGHIDRHETAPLHWDVDHFVLVESKTGDAGVQYRVIERYGLIANEAVSTHHPV